MKTSLSTKGQIILPKEIRQRHGWRAGTRFEVEDRAGSVVLRPVQSSPTTVDDLLGLLPWRGRAKTLAEMQAGIARGARAPRRRGR